MTEPKNPLLLPHDLPGPVLDRRDVPEGRNHRDFLPPIHLEQSGAADRFRNPILRPGSGGDDTPTPPLEPPAIDPTQAGPFGEIRNPKLEPDHHRGEIQNPQLGLPDKPGYDDGEPHGTSQTLGGKPG